MALFHSVSAWACDLQFFLFIFPLIWLWWVVFICAALQGGCFAPSLEHTTLKCHILLQITWEKKKPKLSFYGQKYEQSRLTTQLTLFCTIARDADREEPKPFSQLQFTQYNIAASQPVLQWLWNKDVAGLSLDATSALHRGVFFHPIPNCPLYFPASLNVRKTFTLTACS